MGGTRWGRGLKSSGLGSPRDSSQFLVLSLAALNFLCQVFRVLEKNSSILVWVCGARSCRREVEGSSSPFPSSPF